MTVEDFLPVKAKQTTIRLAQHKPSTQELTTIEFPGKPVPQNLKRKTAKKKANRKVSRAKAEAKDITTKDYILIVTEKPQSALKISQALGSGRKISDRNVSYYELTHEGEKIIVASAVGHLFNLTYKPGVKGWPIFDLIWEPSFNRKNAAFTKRYYDLLKKLSKRAKELIIATDYDIEGEVIGWNVLRFIHGTETAKRMKYSTLTKPELLKSYQNPMKELDWGHAYAGETRHIADWLYGINLSRALMSAIKKTGSFKILSIGRVQGPALKIIVDREREIDAFKAEPFWQVFALVNKIKYKHPKDIFNKNTLEIFKDIKEGNAETKSSEESLQPPHPFDLTTLQREAYRLHKISPSGLLSISQKLYLDGLISYPRTSSQKIPESIEPKKILKTLEKIFPEAKNATRHKPVEGKKSDPAHPSIYPTGEVPHNLDNDATKIYNLIAKRFISAFYEPALLARKRTTIKAIKDPKITFTASGLQILEKSWLSVYPAIMEEKSIPDLNGPVKIDKIQIDEKETQPPKRYTPTSLITTLEKKNLGTKATRSSIVDTLFDRGYLDGKSIKATTLGLKLIEALEKYSPIIIDENLTNNLEEEMQKIQESTNGYKEQENKIVDKVKKIISDISKEFKVNEENIGKELQKGILDHREEQKIQNEIMPCPKCKEGVLRILYSKKTKKYFAACSNYPNCTQTHSLPPNALIKTTNKKNENGLPILIAYRKGKHPWEFPFNPNWRDENRQSKREGAQNNNKQSE